PRGCRGRSWLSSRRAWRGIPRRYARRRSGVFGCLRELARSRRRGNGRRCDGRSCLHHWLSGEAASAALLKRGKQGFEGLTGDEATTADLDRAQSTGADQLIGGRPPDVEQSGGLLHPETARWFGDEGWHAFLLS